MNRTTSSKWFIRFFHLFFLLSETRTRISSRLFIKKEKLFDFIYVDGSHRLLDLYCDLVLSFSLLKIGGVIGIDDYLYNKDTILESPYEGVNHFIEKFKNNIKILSKGYRVFIEKM